MSDAIMLPRLLLLVYFSTPVATFSTPFEPEIKAQFGRVCAFGDFNGDRNTDILVHRGNVLAILLQREQGSFVNGTTIPVGYTDSSNIACSVGDFNEDMQLDVLVSHKTTKGVDVILFTSEDEGKSYRKDDVATLEYEAMSWDINGDGVSDVLGFHKNGSLFCVLGSKKGLFYRSCVDDFKNHDWSPNVLPYPGMSHLFADISNDLSAEIIFFMQNEGALEFQVWKRIDGHRHWEIQPDMVPAVPKEYKYITSPVIDDFNGDKIIDIVIPVCKDKLCATITNFLFWSPHQNKQKSWYAQSFDMPDFTLISDSGNSKVLFRVGDFTLDGFPDLVATFEKSDTKKTYTIILENSECDNCGNNTRKFILRRNSLFVEPWEAALGRGTMSTFFDLKEDGKLDILIEYIYEEQTKFSFIASDEKGDTTFLKVQTYTNICDSKCRLNSNDIGSGISWAGVCMSFEMSDSWLGTKQSVSCQLPYSTHRTLATPFVLFGLGRSPNFVDLLSVGAPRSMRNKENQRGTLKQVVPNSRIVVVPPKDDEKVWQSRLYITPSQLIIQSLLVLSSVCCILLLVVIIFHFKEKKQDRVERQAQSHRFHFDAM